MKRQKDCYDCKKLADVLYRSRVGKTKTWQFRCEECLLTLKAAHTDAYQYGGTWKAQKH